MKLVGSVARYDKALDLCHEVLSSVQELLLRYFVLDKAFGSTLSFNGVRSQNIKS